MIMTALLLMLVVLPSFIFAQTTPAKPPRSITSIGQFVTALCTVMNWLYTFFLVLSVLMILWAAFLYVTSAGSDEKIKQAKQTIVYAVIAIIVAAIAAGLPNIIETLLSAPASKIPC